MSTFPSLRDLQHALYFPCIQPVLDILLPIEGQPVSKAQLEIIKEVTRKAFEELEKEKKKDRAQNPQTIEKFLKTIEVNITHFLQAVNSENPVYIPHLIINTVWKLVSERFVENKLTEGKFGAVFQRCYLSDNTVLVVKKPKASAVKYNTFTTEQRLLARISSQWIVKFLGLDTEGNIILEHATCDLSNRIKRLQEEPAKEKEFSNIIRSILKGIEYLHGKKIAHRDIKPENILLTKQEVKITDFGLSYQLQPGEKTAFTVQAGSFSFMGPENFERTIGARPLSFKSDIWAVGATIFKLMYQLNMLEFFIQREFKSWEHGTEFLHTLFYTNPKKTKAKILEMIQATDSDCKPRLYELKDAEESSFLREIASKCFTFDPNERPGADELLQKYFEKV